MCGVCVSGGGGGGGGAAGGGGQGQLGVVTGGYKCASQYFETYLIHIPGL